MLFLDAETLDRLYPCRMKIGPDGVIEESGPSLKRILGCDPWGAQVGEMFELLLPRRSEWARIREKDALVFVTRDRHPVRFRAAVALTGAGGVHILAAAVADCDGGVSERLRFDDFAPTDGAIDLLLAVQARDASIKDAHILAARIGEIRGAEAESAAKSRFIAHMSHELRTPLNAIIGFTEMLLEDGALQSEEEQRGDLEKILDSSQHLLALINQLLDLAKIESGRLVAESVETDFAEVAALVVGGLQPLAQKNANILNLDIAPDVCAGRTDPVRLRQCLINLVGNALKFTRAGAVTVSLRNEGAFVRFDVSDTGPGITPEDMRKLFTPFMQATGPRVRALTGAGLGLALTRELCRLMGGDVSAESTPGEGSVFTIVLPREAPQAAAPRAA